MKKKLLALVCALALTVSLVGCALSTPDTVGKIGDFEVTSGLYLLAQYDAYQQAAQLAGSEQDTSKVKSFLKATITTDADTGETAVVKDYVAQKTLETLQTLAAVDARFTELGGELTEEQKSAADSYAQQLMDNYGDAYTANGIGLETLKLFQQLQYKHTLLLDLVYGKDGETPVEDGELTEHLDSTMYEIGFITVPLYNTSTFAFASDDQKAEMLSLAQKAADSYNANAPEDTSSQLTAFNSIASSALSMENVLETLRQYNPHRLITMFGAGGNRPKVRRYEMGETSGRLSDLSVVTEDNSRFEDVTDIIEDIKTGLAKTDGKYVVVPNRRDAIKYCMDNAEDGDIIVLAGKGHEDYQEIKGVKYHMDEREIIADILNGKS